MNTFIKITKLIVRYHVLGIKQFITGCHIHLIARR